MDADRGRDADEVMDARLRAAGERWRAADATAPIAAPALRRRRRWAPLLSAAALVIALITSGWLVLRPHSASPSSEHRPRPSAHLSGVVWRLTGGVAADGARRHAGASVLFTIRRGSFVAVDDCTVLAGLARADGGRLQILDLVVRERGCIDQVGMGLDPQARPVLAGPSTYSVSGRVLTLRKPGSGTLTFSVAPKSTPAPTLDVATITGRSWELHRAVEAGGRARAGSLAARLELRDDGSFTATDPCVTIKGDAAVDGNVLRFYNLIGRHKRCPYGAAVPTVEQMFSVSAGWAIAGNTLTLTERGIGRLIYDVIGTR